MRTVSATRYVTPLREGGSLPAVVECSDRRLYVVKFHGAGQGPRTLAAELIVGELARAFGLRVPELVLVELDAAFGRNEPDPEIRELLRASVGTNLGMAFLSGAVMYDPVSPPEVDEDVASKIVCLDAVTLNVDRSARNPNLLVVGGKLWLIDHGAALYFHHDWNSAERVLASRYPQVREHVLLPRATRVREALRNLTTVYHRAFLAGLFTRVPEAWLFPPGGPGPKEPLISYYNEQLTLRLAMAQVHWVEEWDRVRTSLV